MMMNRDLFANIFVTAMLAMGAAVVWHWHMRQVDVPMTGHIRWQPASATLSQQARDTIGAQLGALQRGDFAEAVEYETQSLRNKPRAVEELKTALTTKYPEFCDFASLEYAPATATETGDQVVVTVVFSSKLRLKCNCTYYLVRERNLFRVALMRPDRMFPNGIGWDRPEEPLPEAGTGA